MKIISMIGNIILLILIFMIKSIPIEEKERIIISNFNSNYGRIFLSIEIDGKQCNLLVDSGVKVPVLDLKSVKAFNEGELKEDSISTYFLSATKFKISGIPEYTGDVLINNLMPISKKTGLTVDGIIPLHFPGYEVYIDFYKSKLYWKPLSFAQHNKELSSCNIENILFNDSSSLPLINVLINSKIIVQAEIDFFSRECLCLPLHWVNENKIAGEKIRFARFEQGKTILYFQLNSIKVANNELKHVLVVAEPGIKHARLGLGFWKNFAININFEESKLHFLSQGNFNETKWISTGIILDFIDEKGWKIGVVEDSPAWQEAELRGGEILTKVNGVPILTLSPEKIISICNNRDFNPVLYEFIYNDGSIKEVNLTPQEIF